MMTAVALNAQPHSDWLARIRTINLALGRRWGLALLFFDALNRC